MILSMASVPILMRLCGTTEVIDDDVLSDAMMPSCMPTRGGYGL